MNRQDIISSIAQKEMQLEKLEDNNSSVGADLYNKIVIEKAVLKKDLENLDNKFRFLDGVKKLIPRKKRLICDYFK